jgi:hypothetical protein
MKRRVVDKLERNLFVEKKEENEKIPLLARMGIMPFFLKNP